MSRCSAPSRAPRGRGVRGHQLSGKQVTVVTARRGSARPAPHRRGRSWATTCGIRMTSRPSRTRSSSLIESRARSGGVLREPLCQPWRARVRAARGAVAGASGHSRRRWPVHVRRRITAGDVVPACRSSTRACRSPSSDHDVYDDARGLRRLRGPRVPRLRIAIEYEGDHHRVDAASVEPRHRQARSTWRNSAGACIRVTTDPMVFEDPARCTGSRCAAATPRSRVARRTGVHSPCSYGGSACIRRTYRASRSATAGERGRGDGCRAARLGP